MQSSPKRSESARTTTRPVPCRATAAREAPGGEAAGEVRATTTAPLWRARVPAVEAGLVHAGEEVDAGGTAGARLAGSVRSVADVGAGREVGEHPGRGAVVVLVVLDGAVGDLDAEAGEEGVQVVAVLVLLGLAEDDEPAAAADELFERVHLVVAEPGRAVVGCRLPLGVGRVGDDDDVGARQGLAGEGTIGVGKDVEVAGGERGGGDRIGGVLGVGGLHPLGELPSDGPRL
jgi:hypothetical protein